MNSRVWQLIHRRHKIPAVLLSQDDVGKCSRVEKMFMLFTIVHVHNGQLVYLDGRLFRQPPASLHNVHIDVISIHSEWYRIRLINEEESTFNIKIVISLLSYR